MAKVRLTDQHGEEIDIELDPPGSAWLPLTSPDDLELNTKDFQE